MRRLLILTEDRGEEEAPLDLSLWQIQRHPSIHKDTNFRFPEPFFFLLQKKKKIFAYRGVLVHMVILLLLSSCQMEGL